MSPKIQTQITKDLGIEHPIIQGGMMWVSQPELVAAVSNAGGLGILTALTFETPEGLATAIKKTRDLTSKPFGVNLTLLPTLAPKNYDGFIDVIVSEGIGIVETAGRNPVQYMEHLKGASVKVIHKCTSVRFAKKAESIGCDYVSIDGCECAGHPGEEDLTSLILIPRTVDELSIPVIASGGFADGRGLIAALALGAGAINMGTRFVATVESPVHQNVKDWLMRAGEHDTTYVLRSLQNTERVLKNSMAEKVVALEAEGAGIEELAPLVSGRNGLKVFLNGDIEAGLLTAGLCVGLVNDVPTVAELIERIVNDAQEILKKGFSG
ncbi:MAG: nitronate monooxygenase [Thermoanaerobaculales bacterium]|nr:nitronate monooxygenase [Thermoanaerobaculales bacterium]